MNTPRDCRSIGERLADYGIIYTIHPQSNGTRQVALHSAKGLLGFYSAAQACVLLDEMDDAQ